MKQIEKTVLCAVIALLAVGASAAASRPNIIYILADDWGLGDVKTYGGERCKIDTPHMDRLAAKGMKFTDAHSSSSVCTPTRYGILTGRYNWRSRLKQMVLFGYSSPLIEPGRETVASMLKKNGYTTAVVGKWHLGLGLATTDGKAAAKTGDNVNWRGTIKNGPVSVGFDTFWGISASLDMPPYIWIENDRFVGECTTTKAFHRKGHAHADFEAVDVLPTLTEKAVAYVTEQAKTEQPFFLYMPLNSPHTPIVPSANFQGKSALGPYGDFVMETDWKIEDGNFRWSIVVPPNTMATVYVPAQKIEAVSVDGQMGGSSTDVEFLRMEKDRAVFKVGSGRYGFVSKQVIQV